MIEEKQERNELLGSLLMEAGRDLIDPQICFISGGMIHRHLALEGEPGREQVTAPDGALALSERSVLCQVAHDAVPYFGPVPDSDPCARVCSAKLLHSNGLMALPISLQHRAICLLIGHPRSFITRELSETLLELTRETAIELGKLLQRMRQPAPPAPRPEPQPKAAASAQRSATASPPPSADDSSSVLSSKTRELLAQLAQVESHAADAPTSARQAHAVATPLTDPRLEQQPQGAERREYDRFPLQIQVNHLSDHNFFTGFMEDLSVGGLFIATYNLFDVGHCFELEFALPGQGVPWTAKCEVRWVRVYESATGFIPGMGVRFIDLPIEARTIIERFMRKRPPLVESA